MIQEKPVRFYSLANIYVVICGLAGLALAVFILLGFSHRGKSRFHEIQFGPKEVTAPFLSTLKGKYSTRVKELEKERDSLVQAHRLLEASAVGVAIDSIRHRLDHITERQFQYAFGNRDTVFDTNIHYSINRDSLYHGLVGFQQTDTLLVGYFDPEISPDTATFRSVATLYQYDSSIEFFSKYPSFALWIFLGLGQMVAWFLAIPTCIAIYNVIGKQTDTTPFYKKKEWYSSAILAAGAVGVFCVLLYVFIIYKNVVHDVYFMTGFESAIYWYSLFGYIVSAVSFTGYLYIANEIYQIQKTYKAGKAALATMKVTNAAGQGVQEDANEKLKVQYRVAKKYFMIYFYITAGVLSLVVLWIGALFSAVNSMDVMRYYHYISGLNFLPNDFVYLFGALHSLLLLIFFVPVEMNMFSLNSLIPELENRGEGDRSWGTLLKNIGGNIGNLLVVSSPILASILHGIIASYVNH